MRLAALALLVVVLAFPVAAYPAAPVTWLALAALLAGIAGVTLAWVPLVTVGGTLALIAHAVALLIARPATDVAGAITLGTAVTLLPLVVHFTARTTGAGVGAGVVAAQVREWTRVMAAGIVLAAALATGGAMLAAVVQRASLPVVIAVAALGAGTATAGVVALVARPRSAASAYDAVRAAGA
jgi:hypothetical protein